MTVAVCPFWKKPEKMFSGGKGGRGPQFRSTINFHRPEKGAGFFSPPKYLVPLRLFCAVLRCFVVFSSIFRRFAVNWQQPQAPAIVVPAITGIMEPPPRQRWGIPPGRFVSDPSAAAIVVLPPPPAIVVTVSVATTIAVTTFS